MISILVHYSEIALKGKNRSWFVGRLVRNIHTALAGLHVKEVRTHIGRIEIVLGQDSALPEVQRSPVANLRHRQLLGGHPPAARLRGHGRPPSCRSCRRASRLDRFACSCAAPMRNLPCRHLTWRAISARACGRARLEGRSRSRRPGDPRRDHSRRGVLLHGPRCRRRRLANRHGRSPGGALVRRHRFAGRGVAHDEARLQRHARAFPQRAVPVECVAGEGATARRGVDALPAANEAVSRSIRRAAAADHA